MKVLDAQIDLAANRTILFEQNRPFFYLLLYSAILDAFSTIYFMTFIGPSYETNIMVRYLSYGLGIVIGPILGKILQIFAVWLITLFTPALTMAICVAITCLNCYAFVANMTIY